MANEMPTLLPTQAHDETFGGVTYHLDGELVPVLTVDVSRVPVYLRAPHPALEEPAGARRRCGR